MLNDHEMPLSTRFRVAEYVLEQSSKPFAIDEIRLNDDGPEEALLNGPPSLAPRPDATAEPRAHDRAVRRAEDASINDTHNRIYKTEAQQRTIDSWPNASEMFSDQIGDAQASVNPSNGR